MPGARCTRGLVCKSYQGKRTRAYRSTEITRHPRTQWLYGLWRALPGTPARFATVDAGLGHQDHTLFPYASGANVKSTICVHRSPPRVCDDRETPLCLGRDGENIGWILSSEKQNIFGGGT